MRLIDKKLAELGRALDDFVISLIKILCPGILTSALVALFISWLQFSNSTAGYRVKMVKKATDELTKLGANTSLLRDKFRYSLGVIIDDLHQSFQGDFKENGPWPMLVDNGEKCDPKNDELGDRWDKFNKYVRPVIDDVNAYSFIGLIPILRFIPRLRQLGVLTELCHKLENVVSELDSRSKTKASA